MNLRKKLLIILLLVAALLVSALIAQMVIFPSALPRQRLVLDEVGCRAASHLGLSIQYHEADRICELVAEAAFDLHWVHIGNLSISRDHLIATESVR